MYNNKMMASYLWIRRDRAHSSDENLFTRS